MKAIRLVLALVAVMAASACSSDIAGPGAPSTSNANIVIGSPG